MGLFDDNQGTKSPVTKYLQWSSTEKCFQYWDKELKAKVDVKMPVKFLAIGSMIGVGGGKMEGRNFVAITSGIGAHLNKTLVVKKDGETIATGKWSEVKETVTSHGGKFVSYVYAIMDNELVCFKMIGASLGAYFSKPKGDRIVVKKSKEEKTGAIKYNVPVFECSVIEKDEKAVIAEDENVQKFFKYKDAKEAQKFDSNEESSAPAPKVEPNLSDDEVDDVVDMVDFA